MDVLRHEITPSLFCVVQLDERKDIRNLRGTQREYSSKPLKHGIVEG